MNDRIEHIESDLTAIKSDIRDLRQEIRNESRTTRWTIVAVGLAAVVGGLGALWTTQANLLAAFQAGLAVHQLSPFQSTPPHGE